MSEAGWLICCEPLPMLDFLRGKASDRKLRLFVAHGVARFASVFGADQNVLAELHVRVAEGDATEEDLERFLLSNMPELWENRAPGGNLPPVWDSARMAARERFKLVPLHASDIATPDERATENAEMCTELRCIFGNPFRISLRLSTTVLAWNDGTVLRIAEGIYADRAPERLPVLADALLDAGCDNEELIQHFRSSGPHVIPGCWGVDLIMGRH